MELKIFGHEDRYPVEQLQQSLLPDTPGTAESRLYRREKYLTAVTVLTAGGKKYTGISRLATEKETVRLRRRLLQLSYYKAAVQYLPQTPPWGALAGVRPTKLTTRHLLSGGTPEQARKRMEKAYFVAPDRAALATQCSVSSVRAAALAGENAMSLYIGIPFCPTRCRYCSFVSRTVGRDCGKLTPYLQALEKEITVTGKLLAQSGKRLCSLYIGGGTPTTPDASALERLTEVIRDSFDLSQCMEYTVEAGRPDTVDLRKLTVLRDGGADRISINPQTMQDAVLRACGRPHTAADTVSAYRMAQDAGFTRINMDLIAGLPEDDIAGFCRSLTEVAALRPANITVHTLALKKGADLFENPVGLPQPEEVAQMLSFAGKTLDAAGYRPYYLYRQKYMTGQFENTGWSMDGADCLYNIYMMEELHSILSLGGGGMSKLNLPGGAIRRFHNPKFPEQYIDQLDSVLQQKAEFFACLKGSV